MAKVAPEDMITQLSVRHSPARALDQVPLLVMQTQAIQEGYQQIERVIAGHLRSRVADRVLTCGKAFLATRPALARGARRGAGRTPQAFGRPSSVSQQSWAEVE